MTTTNAAQQASFNSIKYVKAKNKAAWLDLYADDAVIQDPVGVSPIDPTGQGHRGKEAIGRFWDTVAGAGDLSFEVRESYPAGDECANVATLTNRMPGGIEIKVDLVAVYRVNTAGKLVSLKAYWDFSQVAEKLHAALGK
jgi:ketosteroid isomerase-like protein